MFDNTRTFSLVNNVTRINLVDPSELHDQHLVAEYREIFMVGSSLQRSLVSPTWKNKKLPPQFTLNKGHVSFFYDKGLYLYNRYLALCNEMRARGMNPDPARVFKVEQWPDDLFNDWVPSEADRNVVRDRIAIRIAKKPDWYRKTAPI
jgi:deoxyribonuclease (pyrimidine dimer)